MYHSGWRPRLVALLTAIVACVGLLSLSTAPAWAAAGTVTEFPVSSGSPVGITAGPDGNLWFADSILAHLMGYTYLQSRFAVPASCQVKGINSHWDQCGLEHCFL
jgi:streptogramin lyase